MLLIPRLKRDGSLTLDAYSFSTAEIDAVAEILSSANVSFSSEELPVDMQGREGRSYLVPQSGVLRLEKYLRLRFTGIEAATTTEFEKEAGQTYRCEELAIHGRGNGCVELGARTNGEAKVKCALIAHARRWFGGVASVGRCKR